MEAPLFCCPSQRLAPGISSAPLGKVVSGRTPRHREGKSFLLYTEREAEFNSALVGGGYKRRLRCQLLGQLLQTQAANKPLRFYSPLGSHRDFFFFFFFFPFLCTSALLASYEVLERSIATFQSSD